MLTAAWIPKHKRKDHAERRRFLDSPARFKWLAAGRRSGKSTDGLDCILVGHGPLQRDGMPLHRGAFNAPLEVDEPTFVVAAPTREMVKRIWWRRIKNRVPEWCIESKDETEMALRLINGATILLLGMDRPTRSEGIAIDGAVLDEYAYMKPLAYERSLRPALSTPGRLPGWGMLMGKPSGRNHFFDGWQKARDGKPGHAAFHWTSAVVVDPAEIEAARQDLDARSFAQEYEAEFLTQSGLVYYAFDRAKHLRADAIYDPQRTLILCFDFNVQPGAAVAVQELELPPWDNPSGPKHTHSCIVGEVHIPSDSLTSEVCERFHRLFPNHRAPVLYYGDPSGGKRNTVVQSNDWDMVRENLKRRFADVRDRVGRRAPPIVDSVNSVNSRLCSASGICRVAIHPTAAPQTVRDFEGVVWKEDKPDRDIDKSDLLRTHWTDAFRYHIHEAHPYGASASRVGVT